MNAREFEWESQLRFYWVREPDELEIRQCTGSFRYGYEYMGLNGRLVITPLTDRIYLTLTQVTGTPISEHIYLTLTQVTGTPTSEHSYLTLTQVTSTYLSDSIYLTFT